jgi:hypothetical protein
MRATDISINSPCGADWTTMKPSDNKRFCDTCKKHVHDLSAMTKDEAHAVLASPPLEGLCVRFLHDAYGDVVFQPERTLPPSLLVRARRLASYAVVAAIPVGLTACMGARVEAPAPMMGAVACPLPPPPAPSAVIGGEVPASAAGQR